MTYEQYEIEVKSLENAFEKSKIKLTIQYCNANNIYKKGSVFTDDEGSIVVEKIGYTKDFSGVPYCAYYGLELTVNKKPRKDGRRRWAYGYRDINNK